MTSVAFYTLGCKLNFAETSTIGRQLTEHGLKKVDFEQGADIYVINTCSVTENADRKCRKIVREALKINPVAKVIVIGCYAQLKPKEISEIEGVSMVLGAAEKFNLPSFLGELKEQDSTVVKATNIKETSVFIPGFSAGDRTRSFFKVQDGCDYFCTFCTIPLARGQSRSASVAETLSAAREVAASGVREVVLTGVNIGDFGVQNGESFLELIQGLDCIDGIERFRISSIEPNLLSKDIIQFVAQSKKFVPHFHIPLQSGSDTLLKAMRRKYERSLYESRISDIRKFIPDAAIGVDVIVGFPGEGEEEFMETLMFLKELDITYLHVFPYSERANTTAKKLSGKVSEVVKNERVTQLRILSEKKKIAFYQKYQGTSRPVLFEAEVDQGMMSGFTDNYIRVEIPYDPMLVNEIVETEILSVGLNGRMSGAPLVQIY